MKKLMTRCSHKGCENEAELNAPDLENGPKEADLDPVLCVEHEAEYTLIGMIENDHWQDRFLHWWVDAEPGSLSSGQLLLAEAAWKASREVAR